MARITLRQLLDHAAEHGYGLPAYNINNMEQGLAIMEAADAVCQIGPRHHAAFGAPVTAETMIGQRSPTCNARS